MEKQSAPRLKDVAAAAGVSISAASRILRGERDRFGDETCQRVDEAAQKLGWRRNLLVSGIQTGRTKTVGVLIPPHDSFWVTVVSGIHARLAAADYLPITVWVGDLDQMPHYEADEDEGLRQINRLLDRRVDGMIMWPDFGVAYQHHLTELVQRRAPVVVIDQTPDDRIGDVVVTDEAAATEVVAEHLVGLGHKRIAIISSRETPAQTWARERRDGFTVAAKRLGATAVKSWRLNERGDNGVEVAKEALQDELRPTAVFAVTDHEALEVYTAAEELGLAVPEQLSIVGFADLDFAATMHPPLTTVRQRPREIGEKAAELVLQRLDGGAAEADFEVARIPADFVPRDSTAAAPTDG